MTTPLIVVAAVFERDGRILACRRAPGRFDAGRWEFPGGKVEAGETPENALVREIDEELGTSIEVLRAVDRTATHVGERVIDLASYLVRPLSDYPTTSSDHDTLRWVAKTDLAALRWALPDLPTVARLTA
ncbi:(deoxy)nucleoside triphosphate pyrophosphohydrolase [Gryllotalpicola reticulitermitis]|uniref:8-oxo-dGTP diphosphatase n=1 Tax=Gryllotalpicola reticulitermitis TaxID=1184153 RepID=A0ABV8Q6R4_9MICO